MVSGIKTDKAFGMLGRHKYLTGVLNPNGLINRTVQNQQRGTHFGQATV